MNASLLDSQSTPTLWKGIEPRPQVWLFNEAQERPRLSGKSLLIVEEIK